MLGDNTRTRAATSSFALTLATAAIALAFGAAPAGAASDTYTLTQDGNSWTITPLSDGSTVEDFYSFGTPVADSSNTGLEAADEVQLLLWDGPGGLSLVVLIDGIADGTGGSANLEFYGLSPSTGSWVVQDDDSEIGETDTDVSWLWSSCCTDGAAWRGGLDGDIAVTVVPKSLSGISALSFLSGTTVADGDAGDDDAAPSVGDKIALQLDHAFSVHTPGTEGTPRTYLVTQGETTVEVTALSDGAPVEGFYAYEAPFEASANTGLETSGKSQLMLWEGPQGTSLVVLHDAVEDGSGGSVDFTITGLDPASGSWVVMDDPVPGFADFSSNTDATPSWDWDPCCTDGGAWRGGLSGDFVVTIDPSFNSGIDTWAFLSGDPISVASGGSSAPSVADELILDMTQSVTIGVAPPQPVPELPSGLLALIGMGLLGAVAVGWGRVVKRYP